VTLEDHILTMIAEECAEVAQRATKILRFGMSEVQPGHDMNNAARLMQEFADLATVVRKLANNNAVFSKEYKNYEQTERWAEQKGKKIKKFLEYSRQQGRLEE
jgi:translation elongation factor EF-G